MAFDTTERPRFTLFAGPNGAGKTTAYRRFLDAGYETGEYLNPDDIARLLGADETAVEIKAGREVIRRTRSPDRCETTVRARDDVVRSGNRAQRFRCAVLELPRGDGVRGNPVMEDGSEPGDVSSRVGRTRHSSTRPGATSAPFVG